jgi:hypothetical protein
VSDGRWRGGVPMTMSSREGWWRLQPGDPARGGEKEMEGCPSRWQAARRTRGQKVTTTLAWWTWAVWSRGGRLLTGGVSAGKGRLTGGA